MGAPGGGPRPIADRQLQASSSDRIYQSAGNQYVIEQPVVHTPVGITNTLLRDTAAFTGRTGELEQIMKVVTRAVAGNGVIPVHAINGMPGVGKTTLAVHAAHLLADRFPDRQFFLDLHAHTADRGPVDPTDALFGLLTADGLHPDAIPAGLDDRAALWRARMAGKKALLIVDNAARSTQVEPLLPGAAGCFVLITSRRRLTGLRARQATVTLALDPPPADEAAELFTRLVDRDLGPAESDAVADLVRLCGYLPLAISLLAARLCPEPRWTVAGLRAELTATRDRLSSMRAEDVAVAAVFDLSYRDLPAARQVFLRRLGLHPGTDVDEYAGAALTGVPVCDSRDHLEALYQDHLLDQPVRGRYRMHDLIRIYAMNLAGSDPVSERAEAVDRLLNHYWRTASLANRHIDPYASAPGSANRAPTLSCPEQASGWLGAEIGNLFACVAYARSHGRHRVLIGISESLAAYLQRTGPWPQAVELHSAAALSARTSGDHKARAMALRNLGILLARTGDNKAADNVLREALGIYRDRGDRRGEADVANELGTICRVTGRLAEAERFVNRALEMYQEPADVLSRARALNNLGVVRWLLGDCAAAEEALRTALSIYREHQKPTGQADALLLLGTVHRMTDDYPAAADALREAFGIYHDLGDRLGQANAQSALGVVWRMTGDYEAAARELRHALARYQDLGDRMDEANTLKHLGIVYRETGHPEAAIETTRRALDIYDDLGDRVGQADTLSNMASALRLTGDLAAVGGYLETAMNIHLELGSRFGQAEVLNQTGDFLLQSGDPVRAAAVYQRAQRLAREVHSVREEAHALRGAAHCALDQHNVGSAIDQLREARLMYRGIGAPDADSIATELAELTSSAPDAA